MLYEATLAVAMETGIGEGGQGEGKCNGVKKEGKEKGNGNGHHFCWTHRVLCTKTAHPLMACLPSISALHHTVHADLLCHAS